MTFEDCVQKSLTACIEAAQALLSSSGAAAKVTDENVERVENPRLLVALSGGLDSTALLYALAACRDGSMAVEQSSINFELHACHVNHHLRGGESDGDEAFCRSLCERLAIPLSVAHVNDKPGTVAMAAEADLRKLRYEKLATAARAVGAPYIVTAHNQNDQAETLLFRLVRGSSPSGLVGMRPARFLEEGGEKLLLLRPLLQVERRDILGYLEQNRLEARVDSSNGETHYNRNFLRGEILRPLRERFPAVLDNLEHFRRTLDHEDDYLATEVRKLKEATSIDTNHLRLESLKGVHPALLGRLVSGFLSDNGITPTYPRVNRVSALIQQATSPENQSGSKGKCFESRLSLGENLDLLVSKNSILLKPSYVLHTGAVAYLQGLEGMSAVKVKVPADGRLQATTVIPWLNHALCVEKIGAEDFNGPLLYNRRAFSVSVDLEAGDIDALVVRPRYFGDRIQPLGMAESVRLKKYLHVNSRLLDGAESLVGHLQEGLRRLLIPVLANGREVLWVPGLGLSEKIRNKGAGGYVVRFVPLSHDSGFDQATC